MRLILRAFILPLLLWCTAVCAETRIADSVYRNGFIYTVDAHSHVRQAIAIQAGRIVYVGSNSGARRYIGKDTKVTDLHGRMLMPGLVDGHMHPLEGGAQLLKCNLNYEALTAAQFQEHIQKCLDDSGEKEPDGWLIVDNWFQQNTQPPGTELTRETLDALKTKRPILVHTSFGHSTLANTRALELAHITASTPDPLAGKIAHDAKGNPTGILEDEAQNLFDDLIPKPTEAENIAAAAASLKALSEQGITTFLDAAADDSNVAAYAALQKEGKLTVRAHFAIVISPVEGREPDKAIAAVVKLAKQYDQGPIQIRPTITVRNIKLFLDGVISAPSFTGTMLEPYFNNQGTPEKPRWAPGNNRGPEIYFPTEVLKALLLKAAAAGLEPHLHTDGDAAVRAALDGIEVMRAQYPGKAIRAATAHDEIVAPVDFRRFARLDTIPVLSLQWGKPAADTIEGAKDYLGPERFRILEPQGFLHKAGARIAFGSDWPVDPLNEWFALKVGVTRTNDPSDPKYKGRLGDDPRLSRETVVRAITINASYELHQESETGSLEVGKLADFIVLDRNLFKIPAEDIANIKVLLTVVGGEIVYQSK